MKVAVYCGSRSGTDPQYARKARELGEFLGANGVDLVFGGGHVGLMGVVADSVLESGGQVYGVIPEHLRDRELAHSGLTELFVVRDMHERKAKMAELADGFIALPGGIGTLEEIFEAWTWGQLGFHRKPCGLYNVGGFYDPLLEMVRTMKAAGFLKQEYIDMLVVADTPGQLLEGFRQYRPPHEKWT
ncbi:TIGR00730 family Rossman fold protein [Marinobacter sp. M216]|uniref:Cytokinin riboside 5'-monophosphate phosphoribohydrolase n=1 Tax=Marinobacter albus TaxID=3030833 RepID=A0ABT7HDL1_9GAMM|nr:MULTISPECIES: TIGR00730 family Rossman fold protein [unclassified Marinobacter]MBW7471874.1 TIGR00730 family Rossman fold protein [Marinobacter sp. F4218]MDK9558444.1 TIGR00730 family Rossman fold protein [Marinobacter sp. M216]